MWFIIFYVLGKSDSGLRFWSLSSLFINRNIYLGIFNGHRVPSNVNEHREPGEVLVPVR